jgi:LmbE family N-acetylglucosaminyl deacetylase
MISLGLSQARRVLCLGAHSDDIEIGCGGTILRLAQESPATEFYWAVFSGEAQRKTEARNSAEAFLQDAHSKHVDLNSFPVSYFPTQWQDIKERFEAIRKEFEPDLVLTHYRDDRHQDHRVLSDLAWNTFRNHMILEYEILKYDGDLGQPNVFVPISEHIAAQKIELLMKHFATQSTKHWFTNDTFAAMHRIRGIECASPTGLAEAFYSRKLVLGLPL